MVVSEVLVLVNTATRTVIAEEKVNAADLRNVPQFAVLNVLQILAVTLVCIVVSIHLTSTTMSVGVAASERHAIAIQTVAARTNIVSPVKYVGRLDFIVRKTITVREMENVVKLAYAVLHARALRLMTASRGSVAHMAFVVQAVAEIIARLIVIVDRPTRTAANVVT